MVVAKLESWTLAMAAASAYSQIIPHLERK